MYTEKFWDDFIKIYATEYDRLYESDASTGFYVDLFDHWYNDNAEFTEIVDGFVRTKNIFISSDRELAACWTTYCRMKEKQQLFSVWSRTAGMEGCAYGWPKEYKA